MGWTRTDALVLAHVVIWGSPTTTRRGRSRRAAADRGKHPHGGTLRVDACVVDSGDRTDQVYGFCFPRLGRRVWAGKGVFGSRPALQATQGKVSGGRLFLIGVGGLKSPLLERLVRGTDIRFWHTLEAAYFEQVATERKIVRYARGQPVRSFERISGRRAEALDCLIYAHAARAGLQLSLDAREGELASPFVPPSAPTTSVRRPFVLPGDGVRRIK